MVSLSRSIDMHLDDSPVADFPNRADDIRELLYDHTAVAREYPALDKEVIGSEAYAKIINLGNYVLNLNSLYKQTEDLSMYITLRQLEGKVYAEMFHSIATPAVASQREYKRFVHTFEAAGEISNLLNSAYGIYSDAARGEISLRPTLGTTSQLLGSTAKRAFQFCKTGR